MVASGGGFEKSVSNQSSLVWKVLKDHENLGIDEKKFPKIAGHVNQHEGCVGSMAQPNCWEVGEGSGLHDTDARLEVVLPSPGVSVGLTSEADFVGLSKSGIHEAEK